MSDRHDRKITEGYKNLQRPPTNRFWITLRAFHSEATASQKSLIMWAHGVIPQIITNFPKLNFAITHAIN